MLSSSPKKKSAYIYTVHRRSTTNICRIKEGGDIEETVFTNIITCMSRYYEEGEVHKAQSNLAT